MKPYSLRSAWDMYYVDGEALKVATTCLAQVIANVAHGPPEFQASPMHDHRHSTLEMLDRLLRALDPLDVPVTKMTVEDTARELRDNPEIQFHGCGQLLLSISMNLGRELRIAKLFTLDPHRAQYYDPSIPIFGPLVARQFPSIGHDVDQAGKSYACDLCTACVFHAMRCLEAGIRAIAKCLTIADPISGAGRNWGNMTRDIRVQLEARWPASSGRMSGDAKLFDEIFGALVAINNPYRNSTMHLDSVYASTEALHLLTMVKGLMQKIASRMDENGLPLA